MNAADAAVCRRNLERVTAELLDAAEKRAAHIAELVKACLPDGRMTAEDAASAYGAAARNSADPSFEPPSCTTIS